MEFSWTRLWPTRSATRRVSHRWNLVWKIPARPVIAIQAIPAPTPTTWHGKARPSRCRRCSINAFFERLFGADAGLTPGAHAQRNRFRRSILDFVTNDTRKLQSGLGPTDKRKLEEYLSSNREIESQIKRA
ncbi:MAG: DUF1552 domain-containing protein [Acidobacteria bacterium]|nr:DUF1552 domain-containing protein [Acidobacteriota bacterium]